MREPTGQFPVVCPTLILCALAGALLGAMEWLFFATKPSFLMVFSAGQQLMSLLGAVGALGLLLLVAGAMLLTLASVFPAHRAGLRMLAASVVPAAAFTVLGLLLADNFTNTLFGFGSEKSHGLARLCYMALVLGCCAMLLVFCRRWIKGLSSAGPGHLAAAVVILCLCLAANVIVARGPAYPSGAGAARVGESTAYNVLVIGSDGVNAHNLSLYGYDRETSPFLEKLAGESLLALNAFTNSAHTSGMIASLLTGKLPIESGVIYSPDRLHGRHAYQSVPALLRGQYGYRTFQASFPKYADALDMNMKNAFDVVNGRAGVDGAMAVFGAAMLGDQTCLLLGATGERVVSRLLHVFYFQDAHDVYAEVTGEASGAPQITDDQRLSGLLDFIDSDDGPFFAHVHLMGTHGPYFRPEIRKFSARQEQNAEFMPDFYDDAILGFDHYMA
ncbi:MAG: sulfatase-like hydrolase/transferase, partial [Lysobacterales bacterium]